MRHQKQTPARAGNAGTGENNNCNAANLAESAQQVKPGAYDTKFFRMCRYLKEAAVTDDEPREILAPELLLKLGREENEQDEPRLSDKDLKNLAEAAHKVACEAWPEPVHFEPESPPPVPSRLIPGPLRDFVQALAESIQVPLELVLCNALGALAIAAQGKFKVFVKAGHSESLNLYALCPLPPGERKSPVVEACKEPLFTWQTAKAETMQGEIRDIRSERLTLEETIKRTRNKAANAKKTDERRALIKEIKQMERDLPEIPEVPRILADDFTPEALAVLMDRHQERIGLMEAEGGLFETLAGRYSRGVPNLDLVLKAWRGEPCTIDRRNRDPISLRKPLLTLIVSPQPDVIKELCDKPGFSGRGLIARFLFFMPKSLLGGRKTETPPVPSDIRKSYEFLITRLLDYSWNKNQDGQRTAYEITLEQEAYSRWAEFDQSVEKELGRGGEFEQMTGWGGKFSGQAIRLAGLFHLAALEPEGHSTPISAETMSAALDLAAILSEHAKAAYNLMGSDPVCECAKAILAWIRRDRVENFTGRNALDKVKGRFKTMKEVTPGLELLKEREFIRAREGSSRGPGRPRNSFEVNPLVWRSR